MAYMDFLKSARGRIVDDLLILKAKGTVATSMVGEDPVGTGKYYDTGGGRTRGDVVVNMYSMGSITETTHIKMRLQGSKNSSFTTGVDLAITELGGANALNTGRSSLATINSGVGRYIVPFTNDFDDTVYRYLRHYISVDLFTGATGVQYEVYLSDIIT